jgi:hypothetical protein
MAYSNRAAWPVAGNTAVHQTLSPARHLRQLRLPRVGAFESDLSTRRRHVTFRDGHSLPAGSACGHQALLAGPRLSRRSLSLDDSAVPAFVMSCPDSRIGSAKSKTVPRGALALTRSRPPWAWMIDRQDGQPQAQAMRLGRVEGVKEPLQPLWEE